MKTVQMVILPRWGVTIRPREVGILALLRSGENVVVRNPDRWPWYAELHANPAPSRIARITRDVKTKLGIAFRKGDDLGGPKR